MSPTNDGAITWPLWFDVWSWISALGALGVAGAAGLAVLAVPASRPPSAPRHAWPRVSLIVAAHNEEQDLPACLASIAALDYPESQLEVFLVDDRSTDRTPEIMREAAGRHPHWHVLATRDAPDAALQDLPGKSRGVAWAARHATGEWLLITDADARVAPTWVSHMVGSATSKIGLLGASFVREGGGLLGAFVRAVDYYLTPFMIVFPAFGLIHIAVGPNMALRRSVYEAAGGLESAGHRVAEDMALSRMSREGGLSSQAFFDPETLNRQTTPPRFRDVFMQQRRWLLGATDGGAHVAVPITALLGWLALGAPIGYVAASLGHVPSRYLVLGMVLGHGLEFLAVSWRLKRWVLHLVPLLLVYQALVWPLVFLSTLIARTPTWRPAADAAHPPQREALSGEAEDARPMQRNRAAK